MAWRGKTALDTKYNSKAITLFSSFFRKIITQIAMLKTIISKRKSSLDILFISLILGVGGRYGAFMYSVEWVGYQKHFSESTIKRCL